MQLLGAPRRMNHPHCLANPEQQGTKQRMPTRLEQMAEHLQNGLLQHTLHYVKMMQPTRWRRDLPLCK